MFQKTGLMGSGWMAARYGVPNTAEGIGQIAGLCRVKAGLCRVGAEVIVVIAASGGGGRLAGLGGWRFTASGSRGSPARWSTRARCATLPKRWVIS